MANEMTRKTQASVGHRQVPVRKCKAAQRDREASLDRCAVRMWAGDESEYAKQGRQRLRPPRELVWRYLPGIRSALHPGRDAPPRAESPGAFPGSVPDQTRPQSEVDATLIRIRRSFHPAWTIPITRPLPGFSAELVFRALGRHGYGASSVQQCHTGLRIGRRQSRIQSGVNRARTSDSGI